MITNYDESIKINHNQNWPHIHDHLYVLGSGKTNVLLNSKKHQRADIDKIYLYVKVPFKSIEEKKLKNPKIQKTFIDYLQRIDDVWENLEDYNPTKKIKVMIVFDDMIADMKANKKIKSYSHWIVLRSRKRDISLVFISQPYLKAPKTIRLNGTHYFTMKIPNKSELQQVASNHSSDIKFKDLMKLDKEFTKEPYSFVVKDTTLPSDNPLRFRKNILQNECGLYLYLNVVFIL